MPLLAGVAILVVLAFMFGGRNALADQILLWQRGLQNLMAGHVRDIKTGVPWASWALIGAAFAYGFVHAAGPGHGKALMGGAAMGSRAGARKLSLIALAASLGQGIWAIVLVYGGLGLALITARQMTGAADAYLMPLSYAMIGAVGLYLLWRGVRSWPQKSAEPHHHHHDDDCACGHRHGPSRADVDGLDNWRGIAALIGAIAVRPCTGAIMLLVICWQIGLIVTGFWAIMAMAFGTALVTIIAANAGVLVRENALAWTSRFHYAGRVVFPALQIIAGVAIILAAGAVLARLLA